jgi:hypothetical protein
MHGATGVALEELIDNLGVRSRGVTCLPLMTPHTFSSACTGDVASSVHGVGRLQMPTVASTTIV